jgi:hypothetical protein
MFFMRESHIMADEQTPEELPAYSEGQTFAERATKNNIPMELGFEKGETCNRDGGCYGVIAKHEKEGSCSCHSNPPCSYCTTQTEYCPVCEWEASEEVCVNVNNRFYEPIKNKTLADLDRTKIDYIVQSHTHFTMIKEGVYPEGATAEDVRKVVNGSFGGRFEKFSNGEFRFIAYTD